MRELTKGNELFKFSGMSQSGNLPEAVQGLRNPQLIMLLSNSDQFEAHVKKLEELYPQIPSIGCIGRSICYAGKIY